MSQRIFYEIDGRIGGPSTLIQLQLMASSGMLQPHHRVRREDSDQWHFARQVKGLFSETTAPASGGVDVPLMPVAAEEVPPPAEEFPLAPWTEPAPPATPDEGGVNSAFDFFSDSPPAPPPPVPAPPPAPPPPPAPAPTKAPTTKKTPTPPPPVPPRIEEPPPVEAAPEPEAAGPQPAPAPTTEVVGQAVELIGPDCARLLDGKTAFTLQRGWLQAVTKFNDGTQRTVYLNLRSIDAAVLEQRYATRRARGGPYAVLAFSAGATTVALVIQGGDKTHRAFLEKVLLLAGPGKPK